MLRWIWVVLGWISLVTGVIGIFLPLLPTTPFLLLAAFAFSRGSARFHSWLMNHPRLGPPIRDWQTRRVVRPSAKILATVMLSISATWVGLKETIPLPGKAAFAVGAAGFLIFLWRQRSR